MSENILVVEYEPRYTERVRAALAGQPISAQFAKDGEEAMKALEASEPNLIVLSSVVPKISAPELIRAIRGRGPTQQTPILLTVSGYSGNAPKQDAVRMGASDILPKPYSETEFLGKVQQLLGVGQLTSKDIFGEVLNETAVDEPAAAPAAPAQQKKPASTKSTTDINKMLDETLASVMPKKAKTAPGAATILDKKLQDTLSGLEKSARRTAPGTTKVPAAAAPAPAPEAPAAPPVEDKVPVSQPVFPAAVPPLAPPKEEEEPADGVRFGQYVLQEKIATGGMAEVWKARMRGVEGFQKTVAIKKILPHLSDDKEFIEMFVDEAKLAAQLNHNNIIHIYDLGKIANSYYIAMEYVDGHDLKTILKQAEDRHQPMTIELALFIASKVASALDYAHRKRDFDEKEMGLVHRDVSPQNVLVSEDGDIKLCDFGIAKAASKVSTTQAGALKGKLQYMSPEQAWARPIDRRSDIFALATVLYEMLTARKLFTGDNEISILEQVREARVTAPSKVNEEVTPEIDRIVLKALAKEPGDRYQTAGEMARDIDSLLYNFKPTPTSADLAIYMHHLWSAEPQIVRQEETPTVVLDRDAGRDRRDLALTPPKPVPAAPTLIQTPLPGSATRPGTTAPGNVVMPAWDAPHAAKKKSMALPIAAGVVIVLAAGGGYFYMRSRNASPVTPAPAATTTHPPAPVTPPVAASTTTSAPVKQTTASGAAPVPQAPPALDPNAINAEVERRLAADRARLEAQQRAQQQPAPTRQPVLSGGSVGSQAIAPPRPAQQPVQQQATQTVAPPPVQTNTQPAAPVQSVATQETAPPPAPARVREGDLIAPGTEGLVMARILRRGTVPYPQIAREQRIEGTVILNVLVGENGQVLDVKVLRGRPAGLDEAAMQIIRRSTFAPPTKDGVRVKAWTTVPVDFKL